MIVHIKLKETLTKKNPTLGEKILIGIPTFMGYSVAFVVY